MHSRTQKRKTCKLIPLRYRLPLWGGGIISFPGPVSVLVFSYILIIFWGGVEGARVGIRPHGFFWLFSLCPLLVLGEGGRNQRRGKKRAREFHFGGGVSAQNMNHIVVCTVHEKAVLLFFPQLEKKKIPFTVSNAQFLKLQNFSTDESHLRPTSPTMPASQPEPSVHMKKPTRHQKHISPRASATALTPRPEHKTRKPTR